MSAEPLVPGEVYELRVELLPMSFLARRADPAGDQQQRLAHRRRADDHFYGQKVGTDTYHHDRAHPSTLRLHERPHQTGETA